MMPFWKKKNEKVRIQSAVPSFFSPIGSSVSISTAKEARKVCEENKPCCIVLVPDESVFSDRHSWANALSSAQYLVVIADPDTKESKSFMRALDGIVFSPVPRRLAAAYMVRTREEALSLLEGVKESFPAIFTLFVNKNE